jgi:hypothetical protein
MWRLAYPLIKPLFIWLSAYTVYSVFNLGKIYFIKNNSVFLWLAQLIVWSGYTLTLIHCL